MLFNIFGWSQKKFFRHKIWVGEIPWVFEILYLGGIPEIFGKYPLNKKNSRILEILAKYQNPSNLPKYEKLENFPDFI